MKSITSVYKIGNGPSSSHTVGPFHAARTFGSRYPDADAYEVTLYGSLAFTGEGHGTGKAILEGLPGEKTKIVYDRVTKEADLPHPNTMLFKAFKDGKEIAATRIFSIGGGSIRFEFEPSEEDREVYPQKNFSEIVALCNQEKISIIQLVYIIYNLSSKEPSRRRASIIIFPIRTGSGTPWCAFIGAPCTGLLLSAILRSGAVPYRRIRTASAVPR